MKKEHNKNEKRTDDEFICKEQEVRAESKTLAV